MRSISWRIGMCAAVFLIPVACSAQQCDTSAFTYNASTGRYSYPGGVNSATSPSQCSCLQQQWDTINSQIEAEHQNCLNANQGQTGNPNSGSYPGSQCTYGSCQSLHDALYTTMKPKQDAEMAACNQAVANYQANLQAQQAAQQQQQAAQAVAVQVAQQQRSQELAAFKQAIVAQLSAQQNAAQAMASIQQLLQRNGNSPAGAVASQNPNQGVSTSPDASSTNASNNLAASAPNGGQPASPNPTPTPAPNPTPDPTTDSAIGETAANLPSPMPGPTPSQSGTPATSWDPTNPPPIPDAALSSTNPGIQSLVAKIQSLQSTATQNISFQANMQQQESTDVDNAMVAAVLGTFVGTTKFPADATAVVIGTLPGGEGYPAIYGALTGTAGAVANYGVGNKSAAISQGLETGSGILTDAGASMQNSTPQSSLPGPGWGGYASPLGASLSVVGGAVGYGVNAPEAVENYNNGNYFSAAVSGTKALGNLGQIGGAVLESPALTSAAGNLYAAANLTSSYQVSVQALSDAGQAWTAATVAIPQRYQALMTQSQAQNNQIATQQQALYQQLQQMLQSQPQGASSQGASQPVTIVIP